MTPPRPIAIARSDSEGDTIRLAKGLARLLKPGQMVGLSGALGVGKSVFARAVVRDLMHDPDIAVPSPSFTIIQSYENDADVLVLHVDLYRLHDPEELLELGLEDMQEDAITLIEWPDRAFQYLPSGMLLLCFEPLEGDKREIRAFGPKAWVPSIKSLFSAYAQNA